jgi:hypothetical protein
MFFIALVSEISSVCIAPLMSEVRNPINTKQRVTVHDFVYSIHYGNAGPSSSSVSDMDRYVSIRKLLHSVFNIFAARNSNTGQIAHTSYDVLRFTDQMGFVFARWVHRK